MVQYCNPDNIEDIAKQLGGYTLWIPTLSDANLHYTQNRISSVYVYSMDTGDEYIIGFHSNDVDNVSPERFFSLLPRGDRIAYKAKYFNPYQFICSDIDMRMWYYTNHHIVVDQRILKVFSHYQQQYPEVENINDVIPITRILDVCREIRNQVIRFPEKSFEPDAGYHFYERTYRRCLEGIEQSGIAVDVDKFKERTGITIDAPGIIYSEYNSYTLTGRPSNGARGINLNSLNKSGGSRGIIVSRHPDGRLFEFDYDSYHVRIIGSMIGYTFPNPESNLHMWLGHQIFKTRDISPQQYGESKRITFSQIYGGVSPEYKHIDFYNATEIFVEKMWKFYEEFGYFVSPLSKRKFHASWYEDMTKTKMFNYIIQCYETELNMMVVDEILTYLYKRNTKVVMYNYDAIVVDWHSHDKKEVLLEIRRLMNKFGYPVNISVGINYDEMVKTTM